MMYGSSKVMQHGQRPQCGLNRCRCAASSSQTVLNKPVGLASHDHHHGGTFGFAGVQAALNTVTDPVTSQPIKLDIMGFDACLMSQWEIGSILAPYAKHLFGSELLEPGTGWDYSLLYYYNKGWAWSGGASNPAAVSPSTGYTAKDLADILIGGYMVSAQWQQHH